MSKWLEKYQSITTATLATKATIVPPNVANVANVARVENLISELSQLNGRWQKALEIEKTGAFEGLSKDRENRIVAELGWICQQATKIWELLETESPESLRDMYCLEPKV